MPQVPAQGSPGSFWPWSVSLPWCQPLTFDPVVPARSPATSFQCPLLSDGFTEGTLRVASSAHTRTPWPLSGPQLWLGSSPPGHHSAHLSLSRLLSSWSFQNVHRVTAPLGTPSLSSPSGHSYAWFLFSQIPGVLLPPPSFRALHAQALGDGPHSGGHCAKETTLPGGSG